MSSISTLVIKKPDVIVNSKLLYEKTRYPMRFASLCLWILVAVIAVAHAEINNKITGVSITLKMQDILLMIMTTLVLTRGLCTGNPYLVYPWIFLSSWNIYNNQYPNLIKMRYVFTQTQSTSKLAIAAFGIDLLGMVTKTLLILRITQLSINLWYQRKLKNESIGNI